MDLLAQLTTTGLESSNSSSPMVTIVYLAVVALVIAGMWKTFEKAGQPGWAALIPIYNYYVILKLVGKPGWWLVLYLIPVVNLVTHIIVSLEVAKAFGKGGAFGFFGLVLFAPIGYLMLGFSDAKYQATSAN